jgi:hypothetical protein
MRTWHDLFGHHDQAVLSRHVGTTLRLEKSRTGLLSRDHLNKSGTPEQEHRVASPKCGLRHTSCGPISAIKRRYLMTVGTSDGTRGFAGLKDMALRGRWRLPNLTAELTLSATIGATAGIAATSRCLLEARCFSTTSVSTERRRTTALDTTPAAVMRIVGQIHAQRAATGETGAAGITSLNGAAAASAV